MSSDSVESLIDRGRYDAAEAAGERAFIAAAGTPAAQTAGSALVEAFVANGRGAETRVRELAERLVNELRTGPGTPSQLATALHNLGDVWHQSGDYTRAIDAFKEAAAIRERIEPASPVLAHALEGQVQALTEILATDSSAYRTGVMLADQAVAVRRTRAEPAALARSLRVRGLLRQRNGDYARAREDLQESLAILEPIRPGHPDTARSLLHAGEQLGFDGALTKAADAMSRACEMAEATLRPGHPDIAECLRRQAATREEMGDLAGAKSLRERGVAIARASLGETHPLYAVQLNDLANNHQLQNEFAPARALYEDARRAYVARLGARSNRATVTAMNLALLDARVGDYRKARRQLEQVIVTWTETLGPSHPNVARGVSALASLFTLQGLHADARRLNEQLLRVREDTYGPNHPLVARTLSNLAASVIHLGQPRRAFELSARAVRIWEASGSEDGLAEALVTHAEILARSGDASASVDVYQRALALRTRVFGPMHPLVADARVSLATVQARLGDRNAALDGALLGQRIAREHALLALRALPERQALEYVSTRPRGLDLSVSLATLDQERMTVLNELVLDRGLTLDEMSARRRIAAESESAETRRLWEELALARQRLANLIVRGPRGNGENYTGLLDELRTGKEALERALGERSATFSASARRSAVSLRDVRTALPPDAALVSFVRYNRTALRAAGTSTPPAPAGNPVPSYAAFVLRPGPDAPVLVHLGAASAIERAIGAWRKELLQGATADGLERSAAERALRLSGARVRARIWTPILPALSGATRVFVVPDAAMNLVPIAALPRQSGGYLIEERYVVHYLSAERDLVLEGTSPAVSGGLLAVGGVAFDSSHGGTTSAAPLTRSVTTDSSDRGSATCLAFQRLRFPTLPATRRESEEVARLWNANQTAGGESRTLSGTSATETAFKTLAPQQTILHLATHGFFLGEDCDSVPSVTGARAVGGVVTSAPRRAPAPRPRSSAMLDSPLVLSGLAFAGANRRARGASNDDDGILTAEEVATLNLTGVQWAVLSACDTGLGLIRDNEGVLGLRRSFQVAGAHTVIMSLWPAADDATRQWMRRLYHARLVDKRDTADAVRDAALSVLRERRSAGLSGHPFFWGGFVATGDWH